MIDVESPPRPLKAWFLRQIPPLLVTAILGYAAWRSFGLLFSGTEFAKEFTVLGTIIFLCVELAIFRAMEKARYRRLIKQVGLSDIRADLARLLRDVYADDKIYILQRYLRKLADSGRCDCLIRLSPLNRVEPQQPFTMPFEPHPIRDLSLQQKHEPSRSPCDTISKPGGSHIANQWAKRRHKVFNAFILSISFAVLAFYLLGFLFVGLGPRFESLSVCPICGGLLIAFHAYLVMAPWMDCYLVPAGMVIRSTGWLRKNSSLHLFTRSNSVLAVFGRNPKSWILLVADRQRIESIGATPGQAAQFLRAWFSPLDPPTIEQLSDLS